MTNGQTDRRTDRCEVWNSYWDIFWWKVMNVNACILCRWVFYHKFLWKMASNQPQFSFHDFEMIHLWCIMGCTFVNSLNDRNYYWLHWVKEYKLWRLPMKKSGILGKQNLSWANYLFYFIFWSPRLISLALLCRLLSFLLQQM